MTLQKAMNAFVAHRCDRSRLNPLAWAATYPPASPDDVRAAWEAAMTVASQKPQNTYGEGEGK